MSVNDNKPEIKLPLFKNMEELEVLPRQDSNRTFAIVRNLTPALDRSLGYLVELLGKRRARVLAWLRENGDAFACDDVLSAAPEHKPEVYLRNDPKCPGTGGVFSTLGGESTTVSGLKQLPDHDYRIVLTEPLADIGPYAEREMDVDVTLAVSFLTFYHFPLEQGGSENTSPWRTISDVLGELRTSSYPDALDALVYRGMSDGANPLEHHLARELMTANSERVRVIAAQHGVELRRLSSTDLFWTAADFSVMDEDEVDTLQAVEGVLNRAAMFEHALKEKGASLKLSDLTEQDCVGGINAVISQTVNAVPRQMRACEKPNVFREVCKAPCTRGGEWDVRTRFADAAERLPMPFAFLYSFDCNVREGLFEIHASLPAQRAFPAIAGLSAAQTRSAYALRFTAALASVAFGSGVGIIRARVTLHERSETGPAFLSLTLSRQMFAMKVVPLIKNEKLQNPTLTPEEILAMLEPVEQVISLNEDGVLEPIDAPTSALGPRPRIADDTRELPEGLREFLRADRVCDLDIFDSADDTLHDRFLEIVQNSEPNDPAAATALYDILSAFETAEMLADQQLQPLYCANMVSRVIAGQSEDAPEGAEALRFRKIPDTAFDARSVLSRCLRELGNFEDSLRIAKELVELAPTTFSAWHSLALAYAEFDKYSEAAEALVRGLQVASVPQDIYVCYYRLGFALWQMGDAPLGLACYTMVPPHSNFGPAAAEEMADLMRSNNIANAPSRDAAEAVLRSNNIPVAPVNTVCESAARAAIGLVDAGFLTSAEHLTMFLSSLDGAPNNHDVLASVAHSLTVR